ncbi:MAG: 5'/3'-nucleotidase SurE [Thermoprotei archaeon]|nr:MAG: 5'/3'-nucleotidase SurE [Thermoprotei archaeon]
MLKIKDIYFHYVILWKANHLQVNIVKGKTILVTNDDGVYSPGLRLLYDAVKDLGKVFVVAPEVPKSASGLGLTLHKPLRITKLILDDMVVYAVNGTPSDIIHLALHVIAKKIDLVVSGVNIGDNTSVQVILSSGTVGAAAQAALEGIPAIAFSVAVESAEELEINFELQELIKRMVRVFVKEIIEYGFPKGVDVINVNFPTKVRKSIEIKVAKVAKLRFTEYVERRVDPRGREYYWLYGHPKEPEPGTDVYVVLVEKNIAVTPLRLDLNVPTISTDFNKFFERVLRNLGHALKA